MKKILAMGFVFLCTFLLIGNAFASTIIYNNQGAFTTATGAISNGAIPNLGNVGTSETLFDLTFTAANNIYFGTLGTSISDWTTSLAGNDIAISGPENMNVSINLNPSIHAFGFNFYEPTSGTVNVPAGQVIDSFFRVDLFDDSSAIFDSFTFNAPDDQAYFFGVWSSVGINTVQITEYIGGDDNEFFGEFYLGSAAPAPEPATMLLFGLGLLGLAGVNRRKE